MAYVVLGVKHDEGPQEAVVHRVQYRHLTHVVVQDLPTRGHVVRGSTSDRVEGEEQSLSSQLFNGKRRRLSHDHQHQNQHIDSL